jgi:hypothetical protein
VIGRSLPMAILSPTRTTALGFVDPAGAFIVLGEPPPV